MPTNNTQTETARGTASRTERRIASAGRAQRASVSVSAFSFFAGLRPVRRLKTAAPCLVALAFLALAPCASAAKLAIPPWLAEASKRTAPMSTDKENPTVAETLHDELEVTVAPNGRLTRTVREAYRIVTRDGRGMATATIPYDSSSEKITSFKAWLVRPNGEGKTYGVKDAVDASVSTVPGTVYTESRTLILLAAAGESYENCIFAFEYTKEDKGIFGQDGWQFQSLLPVAFSRVKYVLPAGWSIKAMTENHPPIAPKVTGNTHVWEMRDLPAIKLEPSGPPISRIAPRINIDLIPPGADTGARNLPRLVFPTWTAVSNYGTALHLKPCAPDPAVAAKSRELLATLGANAGLWERINVLARYAQTVNYVSIQMRGGTGGGHTPRAASEVLRTGYGDCKDKTALLRALLAAAGIESHSVIAFSGDRYHVTDDWPTPHQFNHAITAIKIDDPAIQSPAIVEHPVLGRLLFFDPTHPHVPLGNLVEDAQGSQVLVLAGERGALVRLPFTAPADNRLARTIEAALDTTGAIAVRLKELSTGHAAAMERAAFNGPKNKYDDWNRIWINNSVPASKITKTDASDSQDRRTFNLAIEFAAPGYAKMMRDKLLVFKPAILGRRNYIPLTKPTRAYPIIIEPASFSENTVINLPEGFTVDEMPPPVEATTRFGHYKASVTHDAAKRQLRYQRAIEMKAMEIPAAEYQAVRQFYETMHKSDQANVVLRRQ